MNEVDAIRMLRRILSDLVRLETEGEGYHPRPWYTLGSNVYDETGIQVADTILSIDPNIAETLVCVVNNISELVRLLPAFFNILQHATEFRFGKHRVYLKESRWFVEHLADEKLEVPDTGFDSWESAVAYVRERCMVQGILSK